MAEDDPWGRAHAAACAQWPGVGIELGHFRAYAAANGIGAHVEFLREVCLVAAVLARDPPALSTFDTQFLTPARTSIERVHRAPHFVDDVLQELRGKLLLPPDPRLTRYTGRSPLDAWIRVTAGRLAIDMARADVYRIRPGPDELAAVAASAADPELELLKRRVGLAFDVALRESLAALAPRERTVLRMHLAHGLSIDELARPYGIHRATAARWLKDIKAKLLDGVHTRMADTQGSLSPSELDSLQRLVLSRIQFDLSGTPPAR